MLSTVISIADEMGHQRRSDAAPVEADETYDPGHEDAHSDVGPCETKSTRHGFVFSSIIWTFQADFHHGRQPRDEDDQLCTRGPRIVSM